MNGHRGRLIIIEGIDGVGKTTQCDALFAALGGTNGGIMKVAEPGGTPMGQHLRDILLAHDVALTAEEMLLTFTLQRAYLMRTVVIPAVKEGMVVLSDRSLVSTLVYQSVQGLRVERVLEVSREVIEMLQWTPKELYVLDVSPEVAMQRTQNEGAHRTINHFDRATLEVYKERRERYLQAGEILHWQHRVVDAGVPEQEVTKKLLEHIGRR